MRSRLRMSCDLFVIALCLVPLTAPDSYAQAMDTTATHAQHSADRAPLYFQHPDGKPSYSLTPKKAEDGRDFKPIYEDTVSSEVAKASTPQTPNAPGKGKILYYRNPMGLPDTSPVPKKDSMGMDYIPVYENEAGVDSGTVQVNPGKLQLLGVRTAPVERRTTLTRTVRAAGTVMPNERTLAVVTTRVGGWARKLHVSAMGDAVKKGDVLFDFYAPELVVAEDEYLVAAGLTGGAHGSHADLVGAAQHRLRALGVPDDEITRLKRTAKAADTIPVRALTDGIVIEKTVVEGLRIEPDTVLYRTVDLSTVWLVARVQERDLGILGKGQKARAIFVAFPGRTFEGTVDYVYPTLSAETRTAQVRIIVPNPDLALRTEMYASVEIEAPVAAGDKQALVVPDSAIIDSGTRQIVLVDLGEGRFQPREVRLGGQGDRYTEILDGLKDGERVVVGANFLIDSESNLRAALESFTPSTGAPQ